MKLVESYSSLSSLPLNDKPFILEKFYPLPFDRYITLQGGAGFVSKCYGFYQVVIDLLRPYLLEHNIKTVLLGGKNDNLYQGVYDARGNTLGQSHYLIRNALLHFGNDSWMAHAAGWLNKPLVALYGSTDKDVHGPYWSNKKETILLDSHRWNRNPTFASQENPMSIALVDPFDVARAVLKLLDIPNTITQKTLNVGPSFMGEMLEWVPDQVVNPGFNPQLPLAVRMDLLHNEENLTKVLQLGRKVNIVTKLPVNLNLLTHFKDSILSYNHEISSDTSPDYVTQVKKRIKATTFFSRSTNEDELSRLRFIFFDATNIEKVTDKTRKDFEIAVSEYTNDPTFSLDSATKSLRMVFKAHKYVLSKGKIYLSMAHEKADLPADSAEGNYLIDSEDFYKDLNHFLVYV